MAQICSGLMLCTQGQLQEESKEADAYGSRACRKTAKLLHPWTIPIFRNLDGWLLLWEGEAGRGLALGSTAVSPLPLAQERSSKLALVSLSLLFPQGRRGKALLQCDPTSLGVTLFAVLLRHLEPAVFWTVAICTHFRKWGVGYFFVILL